MEKAKIGLFYHLSATCLFSCLWLTALPANSTLYTVLRPPQALGSRTQGLPWEGVWCGHHTSSPQMKWRQTALPAWWGDLQGTGSSALIPIETHDGGLQVSDKVKTKKKPMVSLDLVEEEERVGANVSLKEHSLIN